MTRQRAKKAKKLKLANLNPPPNNEKVSFFKPLTENQERYVQSMRENIITVCSGPSGSGKTLLAISKACEWLHYGNIDRIVLARSIIASGKDIGSLPGDLDQKISSYVSSSVEYFERILGPAKAKSLMKSKVIDILPVEMVRGHTYRNAAILLEEAQNVTLKQLKAFMTRIGENSSMIITGDTRQSDIKSGTMDFMFANMQNIRGLGLIKLELKDVLRHPIIPDIIEVFDRHEI